MNNISQISVFDYREIEILGDLERLKLFFENVNDEELCESIENTKKNGKNDYPVRVMLNLIYAMKIFGHRGVESFRRELSRNAGLRAICGLSDGEYKYFKNRKHLVPPARVYKVPLSTDYRIFVPIARDSKKFKTKYKMRTEVE